VQVGCGNAHDPVVGALELGELPVGEHRDVIVGREGRRAHARQHHTHPAAAQLGHQRGDDVFDAAVPGRRHREPRAGVDEHGLRHGDGMPVSQESNAGTSKG
jgi:hypothetical protein